MSEIPRRGLTCSVMSSDSGSDHAAADRGIGGGQRVALRPRLHGLPGWHACRRRRHAGRHARGVRHHRRTVGVWEVDSAAHRIRSRDQHGRLDLRHRGTAWATCSRTPRCCRGAPWPRMSSSWRSSRGMPKSQRAEGGREHHRSRRARRLRGEISEAAVRRDENAGLAGPLTRPAADVCSCSTSRSARWTRSPANG